MSSPRAVRAQRTALLAIGDEVLRGEVSNTNAAYVAERLFEGGYELTEQIVVSDDPQSIRSALVRLRAEMDVIIATGGLGPTEDDRTVDVVAELLATGTSPDEPSLDAMKKRFSTHGFEMTPNNLRQVRIPNGARALPNTAGIAPGFVVSLGTAEAFFLPGVPREMAEGVKRVCGSSVAVSITGVAGPEGGAADKPVGTVCFAVCGPGTTRASTKLFAGGREKVRLAAAFHALDLARRYFDTRKR